MGCGCETGGGAKNPTCSCAYGRQAQARDERLRPTSLDDEVSSPVSAGHGGVRPDDHCGAGRGKQVPHRERIIPTGDLIPPPPIRPRASPRQRLVAGLPSPIDLTQPATESAFSNAWNQAAPPPKGRFLRPGEVLRPGTATNVVPGTEVLRPLGSVDVNEVSLRSTVSPALLSGLAPSSAGSLGLGGSWYPPHGATGPDKCVTFQYRDEAFCIPLAFLNQYQTDAEAQLVESGGQEPLGTVSSTGETILALWSEFLDALDASGGRRTFITDPEALPRSPWNLLRDCWSIPTDGSANAIWTFSAHGAGAQALFFNTMCCLPVAYSAFIDDVTGAGVPGVGSWHAWCAGFGAFVSDMLRTGEGVRRSSSEGERPGTARVMFSATEPTNPDPDCRYNSDPRSDEEDGCRAPPWFWWQLHWQARELVWAIYPISGWSVATGSVSVSLGGRSYRKAVPTNSGSATGCRFGARSYGDHIYFHAADIAARATIVDRILWLARLARDFFVHGHGSVRYLLVAKRLANYALRYVLEESVLLVHELGHKYLTVDEADMHCEAGCCYDVAAQNFRCHVIGALGLPVAAHQPSAMVSGLTLPTDHPVPARPELWVLRRESRGTDDPDAVSDMDPRVAHGIAANRTACRIDSMCALPAVGTVGAGADYCVTDSYCDQSQHGAGTVRVIDFDYSNPLPACSAS